MSLALVQQEEQLNYLMTIAKNAQSSGLYAGIGGEQKIFMILMAAHEMNIPPMMALNGGLWNIKGKIEISARLMTSLIRRAGHSVNIKRLDNETCILEGKRRDNGDTHISEFSIKDAEKAGLFKSNVWQSYTQDMLYARAISRLGRRLFADLIGMAYVEGEIRDAINVEQIPRQEEKQIECQPDIIEEDLKPEEVTEYIQKNWMQDEENFRLFMDDMCKSKNWTYRKCIQLFDKHLEHTKKTFMGWLSVRVGI